MVMWRCSCGDGRIRPSREGEAERPSGIGRFYLISPNNRLLRCCHQSLVLFPNILGGQSLTSHRVLVAALIATSLSRLSMAQQPTDSAPAPPTTYTLTVQLAGTS